MLFVAVFNLPLYLHLLKRAITGEFLFILEEIHFLLEPCLTICSLILIDRRPLGIESTFQFKQEVLMHTLVFLKFQLALLVITMQQHLFLLSIQTQVFGTALSEESLALTYSLQLNLSTFLDVVTIISQAHAITKRFLSKTVFHLGL